MKPTIFILVLLVSTLFISCEQEETSDIISEDQQELSFEDISEFVENSVFEPETKSTHNSPLFYRAVIRNTTMVGDLKLQRARPQNGKIAIRGSLELLNGKKSSSVKGVIKPNKQLLLFITFQDGTRFRINSNKIQPNNKFSGTIVNTANRRKGTVSAAPQKITKMNDPKGDVFNVSGLRYDVLRTTARKTSDFYSLIFDFKNKVILADPGDAFIFPSKNEAKKLFGVVNISTGRKTGIFQLPYCAINRAPVGFPFEELPKNNFEYDLFIDLFDLDKNRFGNLKIYDKTFTEPINDDEVFTGFFRPIDKVKFLVYGKRLVLVFPTKNIPRKRENFRYGFGVGNRTGNNFKELKLNGNTNFYFLGSDNNLTCRR